MKPRIVLTLVSVPALVVAAAIAGGPASGAATPSHAYRADDYADGRAMSILPPGENGLVNLTDALQFELLGKRPPASQDQLGKYANLLYGYPSLTDATLGNYYDDESFGVQVIEFPGIGRADHSKLSALRVVIARRSADNSVGGEVGSYVRARISISVRAA
jgi:hypothetical protein